MPYPPDHPLRAGLDDVERFIDNLAAEARITGRLEFDPAEMLSQSLGHLGVLAAAVRDLLDHVDDEGGQG